ncbi:integral membrane protein [Mycena amicta]|nr:integral membrane protein [Mycena amicta]
MPPRAIARSALLAKVAALIPPDAAHPLQVSIRTYCLAACLSLLPSLVPFVTLTRSKNSLKRVLYRELHFTGFAFAVTAAVGGGSFLREAWRALDESSSDQIAVAKLKQWISSKLSAAQKTFLSNVVSSTAGLLLLQAGRRRASTAKSSPPEASASRTLDLTLLLLVRALDAGVQSFVSHRSGTTRNHQPISTQNILPASAKRAAMRMQIDSLVFWACSARIMWCFFYEPERLPRSYVKWINALAGVDPRLLEALRGIRARQWSYTKGVSHKPDLLTSYARDLGYPAAWGDPALLPASGGSRADEAWKLLGLTNRSGVGGLPCQLVHAQVGSSLGLEHSCTANASLRGLKAFFEAIAIYLPVQFLPILLSRPRALLDPQRILQSLFGAVRSATFLSGFLSSFWFTVCLTRTLVGPRLFPSISHDFWDSELGCVLAGCLVCGSSIWIENGRRRGEMALYVLPRAVRTCLPRKWVVARTGALLTFILSLSSLLTAASHYPHVLRGLSRWGLRFIVRGPGCNPLAKHSTTSADDLGILVTTTQTTDVMHDHRTSNSLLTSPRFRLQTTSRRHKPATSVDQSVSLLRLHHQPNGRF